MFNHFSTKMRKVEDPDPFTIATLIFAAISAVSSLVQLLRERKKDEKERRRRIENSIFGSFRELYRLVDCHKRFRTYIEQNNYIDSPLGPGRTPLPPEPETRKEMRELFEEISDVGLRLSEQLASLGDEVAESGHKEELQGLVLELDKDFYGVMVEGKYRDYHKKIDSIIWKVQEILRKIAGVFSVRAPEQD